MENEKDQITRLQGEATEARTDKAKLAYATRQELDQVKSIAYLSMGVTLMLLVWCVYDMLHFHRWHF